MADGTYQRTEKSSDAELNKLLFYAPYGKHIIKLLLFVSSQPKVGISILLNSNCMYVRYIKNMVNPLGQNSCIQFPNKPIKELTIQKVD